VKSSPRSAGAPDVHSLRPGAHHARPLTPAEKALARLDRDLAAMLVKGMADPYGAVTMNPAPITADRIAKAIRALPDTAAEPTRGDPLPTGDSNARC
jgi:hypothetical protein